MYYSFNNRKSTVASVKKIWEVWTDVDSWPAWDPHCLGAQLKGSFTAGSKIYYKPKDGPAGDNDLTEVVPLQRWVTTSATPFGPLTFTHTITDDGASRSIDEKVEANGLIAPLFRLIWARKRRPAGSEMLAALASWAERPDPADGK